MKKSTFLLSIFIVTTLLISCFGQSKVISDNNKPELKVLIIDGQGNHGIWPKTTAMMKDYLVKTGMFSVDIYRTKYLWFGPHSQMDSSELVANYNLYKLTDKPYELLKESKADPNFAPVFSDYDVIVNNFGWKVADWPVQTQKDFEAYMANGGGMVLVHAADNAFGQWVEYNKMIGLGGWGSRTKENGPYVYYSKENKITIDTSDGGCGSHGPQHEAMISIREPNHPIVKGLPSEWLHTKDEVYERLRGPGQNMTILATAYSGVDKEITENSAKSGRTDRHEPMLMVLDYKKGRVFHITLGHSLLSFESVGLKTVFERGTEWAATGKVTQKLPANFPSKDKVSRVEWKQ
jgi:type 1 glutamine amidotransferase